MFTLLASVALRVSILQMDDRQLNDVAEIWLEQIGQALGRSMIERVAHEHRDAIHNYDIVRCVRPLIPTLSFLHFDDRDYLAPGLRPVHLYRALQPRRRLMALSPQPVHLHKLLLQQRLQQLRRLYQRRIWKPSPGRKSGGHCSKPLSAGSCVCTELILLSSPSLRYM